MNKRKVFATFFLHDHTFAIEARHLREVVNNERVLSKIPGSPEYFKGMMNLRGLVLPVIDLNDFFTNGKRAAHFENVETKIAVVENDECIVAIGFSAIDSIVKVTDEDIVENEVDGSLSKFVKSGHDFIQILDVQSLVVKILKMNADIFQQQKKFFAERISKKRTRKQCVKFCLDKLPLLIKINEVKEIISISNVENSSFDYESLLGRIDLRGEAIPLFSLSRHLGMNDHQKESDKVLIVENELGKLGLCVDSIDSIVQYDEDDIKPVLAIENKFEKCFDGMIQPSDDESLIIFNPFSLFENKDIKNIVVGFPKIYPFKKLEKSTLASNENFNRRTVITFKVGREYGMDIQDVSEITELRDNLIESPYLPKKFRGFLNLREQLIPLIDPRILLKEGKSKIEQGQKIMIFDQKGVKVGLFVDEVCSIVTASNGEIATLKTALPPSVLTGGKKFFDEDVKETIRIKKDGLELMIMVISKDLLMEKCHHQIEKNRVSV